MRSIQMVRIWRVASKSRCHSSGASLLVRVIADAADDARVRKGALEGAVFLGEGFAEGFEIG
jgi:hypothetical protein